MVLRWAADVLRAWPDAPTALRAPVLQLAGTLAFFQCDYAESTRMVEQAYDLYARDSDDAGLVWCTSRLGAIARGVLVGSLPADHVGVPLPRRIGRRPIVGVLPAP